MANVTIRKEDRNEARTPATSNVDPWEPARMLRSMLRFDPFREMTQLWPDIERGMGFAPAFEVKETKDAYVIKADVPGVKDGDVEVTLTGNRLTISGKREDEKQEKSDAYYVYERSYGHFTRSFTMPAGVDASAVAANLEKGVLTVTIGKKPELQAKKIAISGEGAKKS